jgi:hypothetical protein
MNWTRCAAGVGRRARAGEVGLRSSTREPAEQREIDSGGRWGGKGADQGEHRSVQHEPDTERGTDSVDFVTSFHFTVL